MLCPQHGVEFKLVPAGISKKTGQPYNAFYSCPIMGCKLKPNQPINNAGAGGYPQKESPKMTKEDWEAKDAKKNKDILLQVAFKAAVELEIAGKTSRKDIGGAWNN